MSETLENLPPETDSAITQEAETQQELPDETVNDTAPQQPLHPRAEVRPFYALNEEEIRAQIAEALRDQPNEGPLLIYEDQVQPEGRVGDIEKARLMAEAEHPYRIAAKAKFEEAEAGIEAMKPKGEKLKNDAAIVLLNAARHPIKMAKASKKIWDSIWLESRAWNAAEIVGSQYDKMVSAALPFAQRLDVLDILSSNHSSEPEISHNKKPVQKASSLETQTITEQLRLDSQLKEQLEVLRRAGVLEQLSSGEFGIKGEAGEEFTAPTPEQIHQLVEKNLELVKYKAGQGFTRLLVVPAAAPAERLAMGLRDKTAAHFHEGQLHDSSGKAVDPNKYGRYGRVDSEEYGLVNDLSKVEDLEGKSYFDKIDRKTEHRGKTSDKKIVAPGWKIVLIKNMPQTPQTAREIVSFGGRGEFVPGTKLKLKPKDYVEMLHTRPILRGEVGLTIEMWLTYALTELEREGMLIDSNGGTLLLGSYAPGDIFTKRRKVPWIGWDLEYREKDKSPRKLRLLIGAAGPKTEQRWVGVRTAVELS